MTKEHHILMGSDHRIDEAFDFDFTDRERLTF